MKDAVDSGGSQPVRVPSQGAQNVVCIRIVQAVTEKRKRQGIPKDSHLTVDTVNEKTLSLKTATAG
jgi:hypothetical protein